MRTLRRLGLVLCLVLALVAGQQLVLWHDVGHAGDHLSAQDDGHGGVPSKCEQHSACAQLSGALGTGAFAPVSFASAPPRAASLRAREASLAPRHRFLSRAPPHSLG